MAEAVGVAASVITLFECSDKIITFCKDVARAPKEMQDLKGRLENLQEVLKEVQSRLDSTSENTERRRQLEEGFEDIGKEYGDFTNDKRKKPHHRTLAILTRDLQEICQKFGLDSPPKKKCKLWRSFKFVRAKPFLKDKNESIKESVQMIQVHLQLKSDQDTKDYQDKEMERRQRKQEAKLRSDLIAWLSPLSFIAKREDLYRDCFKEVGDWLWQDQVFLTWVKGSSWFLQCKGFPMVGKTVLASMLKYRLPTAPDSKFVVLSVFLDFRATTEQTEDNIIASLLKQLLQQDDPSPIHPDLEAAFKKANRDERSATAKSDDILDVLRAELKHYERVYLVVDGFDEIRFNARNTLMTKLLQLDPERVSILVFTRIIAGPRYSRPASCDRCGQRELRIYFSCQICQDGEYHLCFDCKAQGLSCLDDTHPLREPYQVIDVDFQNPSHDIEKYVRWRVSQSSQAILGDPRAAAAENPDSTVLQDFLKATPDHSEEIIQNITTKAKGRFLFAKLYMDTIDSAQCPLDIKKALRSLPDDVDNIYRNAFRRLEDQEINSAQAMPFQILGFISHTRRPLSRSELVDALAITRCDIDAVRYKDFADFEPAKLQRKTILDSTAGLAIVGDQDTEVRLVHETLEVYVRREETRRKYLAHSETDFAKACLTYIHMVFLDPAFQPKISQDAKYPFLKYVCQYWGDHVREAVIAADSDNSIQRASIALLGDKSRLSDLMQIAWKNSGGLNSWDVSQALSLHVCAWYGLSFAITALNLGHADVDIPEPRYGQTPLMYACRKGHKAVVQQLLALEASFAMVSVKGQTAMFEAVANRHDHLVELLLETKPPDLDINAVNKNDKNRTVLMLAAREVREDKEILQRCRRMCEALLKFPGINVDQQDLRGMTALHFAVIYDNIQIVSLLLKVDADLEVGDFAGRSALRLAAERNHIDLVRMLLKNKADPGARDRQGGSPIFHAARRGAWDALEIMLEESHGGGLYTVDELGQTLLHSASVKGHSAILHKLIAKGLDPNAIDHLRRTPLHIACQQGQKTVVLLLLDKGADPSLKDDNGRTPKIVAWQYGYPEIVEALQISETKRSSLESEPTPSDSLLPIWAMAHQGQTDLLSKAIKTRPNDLAAKEPWQQDTAIQCAIEARKPETVQLLLSLPTARSLINEANRLKRTALHTAALCGDVEATCLMLADEANIDLNAEDCWNSTPLQLADGDNIVLDAEDRWNSTPLQLAESNWHPAVMLELVKGGATIDEHKFDVQKLFFYAVHKDDDDAVQILLNSGIVDKHAQDTDGLRAEQIADSDAMKKVLARATTLVFRGNEKSKTGGV